MYVIGIEKISSSITSVNLHDIADLFNISENELSRPIDGAIDLLLGVRYAGYHPVRCDHRGHLLLLQKVWKDISRHSSSNSGKYSY